MSRKIKITVKAGARAHLPALSGGLRKGKKAVLGPFGQVPLLFGWCIPACPMWEISPILPIGFFC